MTDPTCPVCPHPLDTHDRISARYCSATTAGGVDRGCVCVGAQPEATATPGTTQTATQTRKNYAR